MFTQPSTHSIILFDEPFWVGINVQLSRSSDGDNRVREFKDYAPALAYAGVLRLEFGLPIVDRCVRS